ncbi:MAG: hypothetical protein P4N60_04795 [Verrucomicrobiae bacterium]|nr:hypothetical protein [Verrucomicrobiae bacterium]
MPDEITNFIYVLFGDVERFYIEAAYSISTLRRRLNPQNSRIIVFTDHPEKIRSWPVTGVSIAGQIGEMQGVYGYNLRVKLGCLLQSLETYPGNTVFVDSDTFFKKSPDALKARWQDGCVLIHRLDSLALEKSPYKGLQLRLPDGLDYKYGPESCMFNSGVIGLRPADVAIVKNALVICDAQLQRAGKSHICEQLAISEAIRISGRKITETDDVIAHYYRSSAKKYMQHQISRTAARQRREPWALEQPVPYSYLRVQGLKFWRWLHK